MALLNAFWDPVPEKCTNDNAIKEPLDYKLPLRKFS